MYKINCVNVYGVEFYAITEKKHLGTICSALVKAGYVVSKIEEESK